MVAYPLTSALWTQKLQDLYEFEACLGYIPSFRIRAGWEGNLNKVTKWAGNRYQSDDVMGSVSVNYQDHNGNSKAKFMFRVKPRQWDKRRQTGSKRAKQPGNSHSKSESWHWFWGIFSQTFLLPTAPHFLMLTVDRLIISLPPVSASTLWQGAGSSRRVVGCLLWVIPF